MKKKKIMQVKFIKNIKTKRILLKILYFLMLIVIMYNIVFLINTTITKKSFFKLFEISFFCAEEDLMKPDFRKNDLIIAKDVKLEDINVNDIIVYRINDNIRINKVFNIYNNSNNGEIKYITKSNLNYYPDIEYIDDSQLIGRKISSVYGLGLVMKVLQSKITTCFIVIILCFKFYFNKYMYEKRKERTRKKKKMLL